MSNITDSKTNKDLRRENHKGTVNQPSALATLLAKDVHHGCALPITYDATTKMKGTGWASLNVIDQWTINAIGTKTQKR